MAWVTDAGMFCRADELKLGMVVIYPAGLRKRIVRLDLLTTSGIFPGHVRYEFDGGGCATRSPDDLMRVEVGRVLTPEFES